MRGTATEYSSHEKAHWLIHCPLSVFIFHESRSGMVRVNRNHEPGPRRRIDHSAGGTHVHGACRERGKAASGSIKVLTLEVLWVRVAPYMGVVRRRFAGRERARCTTPARGMGCGDQEKPVVLMP